MNKAVSAAVILTASVRCCVLDKDILAIFCLDVSDYGCCTLKLLCNFTEISHQPCFQYQAPFFF